MEAKTKENYRINPKTIANILLVLTTLLWGTSFIITKNLTQEVPIFLYLGIRFSIAIIGFIPYLIRIKRMNKKILLYGTLTGLMYYIAIVFQTLGIQTTTAGKAAFITGLSTIMVPFITWLGFRKAIKKRVWLAVIISISGMVFLLLEGETNIIIGDFLVLLCAVLYAFFIVLNDKYVRIVDVYLYSMVQLTAISVLSFGGSFLLNETYDLLNVSLPFWLIFIYMGLAVTTGTFIFQNWSQQHQGPTQTAIIFTLEPVFAVIFASFIIGDETMTWLGWLGCALIFIAILITVIKNSDSNNVRKEL
ncbi:MAG: DMT family transporter [Candidatus Lokiarchaeota archaeon]|nr:DMT family transporter [Candidatus Lokiarchaeota archaeon]